MINKKVLKLRREYKSLTDKIESLIQQQESKLEELQSKCNHPLIAEKDYENERICEVCGYEEEGWGCGYKKLDKKNVRQIDNDTFNLLRYPLHEIISTVINR